MKAIHITIICVLAVACGGMAYELPEVIGTMTGRQFADDFCWVGDQNKDGYDDLLIRNGGDNRADLFYGGERMEDEPGFSFLPFMELQDICHYNSFLGRIVPDRLPYIALTSLVRSDPALIQVNLYELGDDLDDEPEITISRIYGENSLFLGRAGFRTRPVDLNGDGYDDILAFLEVSPAARMLIFFGGEEFDTIPDWERNLHVRADFAPTVEYSAGYDVNADGYEDVLLKTPQPNEHGDNIYWYSLYLGGSPMDTTPVFSFREDHFEGRYENRRMIHGFSMLPDVNDDGYDDWGIYWSESYERYDEDGFLIFFGSEEPDMEYDLELEGHRRLWHGWGDLTGGDFNADGIGDIATRMSEGNAGMSEVHIHFGSHWIDGESDIYINLENDYDGEYYIFHNRIGAVGDYNGDNVQDFVISGSSRAIVFAGNQDWRVGVETEQPPDTYELTLRATPNPFNSSVTITYETVQSSSVRLAVYDVRGRLVEELENRRIIKEHHRLTWENRTSGIYFILLETGDRRVVKKIVCMP